MYTSCITASHLSEGLHPCISVFKGITLVFSLFRSHWLAVKCCFIFCIISGVLLHEDRSPANIFKIDAHLVRIFSFLQLKWWSYKVCHKCCSFMDVVCTQFVRFESRALPLSIWYEMSMNRTFSWLPQLVSL